MCNIAAGLLRLAEKIGDKDKIIKYQGLFIDYYKMKDNSQQMTAIETLEAKFKHRHKEQEIVALQKETAWNKKIIYFSAGTALLSLITLFFLIGFLKLKLKSASQEKYLLEAQAKDAELQTQLREEEARRLELEQKIIQQQNEQLQKEVFARTVT